MVEYDEDSEFHEVEFDKCWIFLVGLKIRSDGDLEDRNNFTYESMWVLDQLDKYV
jgi:hypothetical protein